ncbi:hypothetical protein COU39_00670 [Candidatus Micrarchaeota archaeon CG10_big_fil_rev_8_21_14_0_10_60_32]|nr:MAG: hypothetical protein COU39_00670 [Candidatus Micrarchaeota archaeon CG10_big_fil_rev_8_21_14_0_10_60_32]PIO02001.1 MAG: hypothetical protein COT58_02105 [Candidatus Micrarchaeota archaeon CG09_land_8_20_14_0_10_60_16]
MKARNETQGLLALGILAGVLVFAFNVVGPWSFGGLPAEAACVLLCLFALSSFMIAHRQSSFEAREAWGFFTAGFAVWVVLEFLEIMELAGSFSLSYLVVPALTVPAYALLLAGLYKACRAVPKPRTANAKTAAALLTAVAAGAVLAGMLYYGKLDALDWFYAIANVALAGWSIYALTACLESGETDAPFKLLGAGLLLLAMHSEVLELTRNGSGAYPHMVYAFDGIRFLGYLFLIWAGERQAKLGA